MDASWTEIRTEVSDFKRDDRRSRPAWLLVRSSLPRDRGPQDA